MKTRPAKRILIIRLSAIGDVVMASPLIAALKRSWPGSEVEWLVEENSEPVLRANAHLDAVILWPRNRWRELARSKRFWTLGKEFFSFVRGLRKRGFDMVIDAQGLLKSGMWAYLSGAKQRIGIGSKEGSRLLMTRVVDRTGSSKGISSQYRLLAEALGLDTGDFSMEVALEPQARAFAKTMAEKLSSDYAVLCPFTTRPQKHWLEERWKELAGRLEGEMDLAVVLLGGPGDREAAERIRAGAGRRAVDLAGETSIQEAAAVISRSSLLIGVDTGLTHMGYALGVPTLALFGATRPYLDTGSLPGRVLYHPWECSPCRRTPTCDDLFPCMRAITVEEVVAAARSVLGAP